MVKSLSYIKINSVNILHLINDKINGLIEESNGNKYLTLVSPDESKDTIKKYEELWNKIRDLIRSMTNNSENFEEKYRKMKLNSDYDLPLRKILKLHITVIVAMYHFHEGNKYYTQDFLDKCLYKLSMLKYDRVDVFKGIDVNKTNGLREFIICHYWHFLDINFKFDPKVVAII